MLILGEQIREEEDFGVAVQALKSGLAVSREGWNGKGMFLILIDKREDVLYGDVELGVMQEFIAMKTAQNTFVPWLASQTDVLASDWCVYEC